MSESPRRIQLRRAKGWRMPPDTVKVDRTTKWGNPFVVGIDGTAEDCVHLYIRLLSGLICLTAAASTEAQILARGHAAHQIGELHGKNLACWCRQGKPCHADVLLKLANAPRLGDRSESQHSNEPFSAREATPEGK